MLPRGSMSRERLSQVLLVYVALGADIIELFDLFELNVVMKDFKIFIVILAVWSLSLCQFSLLLASSGENRKARFAFVSPYSEPKLNSGESGGKATFDPVEVVALCMTLVVQDIPFLCVRLYIMVKYRLVTNTLLFFACKNLYVILLQLYRMMVITLLPPEKADSKRRGSQDHESASGHDQTAVDAENIELEQEIRPSDIAYRTNHQEQVIDSNANGPIQTKDENESNSDFGKEN